MTSGVPASLGKYDIRGVLGRGAMGTVYDGWDPAIHRRVAIKTVPLPDAADEEAVEGLARFKREAQAAGRLTHPNIVGVFDYGETETLAYIVMEFVEGRSLKDMLGAEGRMAAPDAVRLMQDVLAGLAYSHGRGVVHRDIKPANVMVTAEGQAKVADFGIARLESSSMTQAGTVMGTPAYMSPEQFMGQAVDGRTDIYSCGVVLYQLLAGERPFEGSMASIMHKAMTVIPPRPSELAVTAPVALDGVVAKAMARRPEDRFASAADFAQALAQPPQAASGPLPDLAGGGPAAGASAGDATIIAPRSASQPRTTPSSAAAPRPRRLPVLLAGGAAVLAAAGVAGWLLLPGGASTDAPRLPQAATPVPVPEARQQAAVQPTPTRPSPVQPAPFQSVPAPFQPNAPAPQADARLEGQPDAARDATRSGDAPRIAEPAATVRAQPPASTLTPAPSPAQPPVQAPVQAPIQTSAATQATAASTIVTPPQPPPAPGGEAAGAAATTFPPTAPQRSPAAAAAALAASLSGTACTLAQGTTADGGAAVIGLAGNGPPSAALRAAAEAAGAAWQVQGLDGPFCPALDLLRPLSGGGLRLRQEGGPAALVDDQMIAMGVTMPGFAGFLHVAYLQSDRVVSPLVPGPGYPAQTYAAGAAVALGGPGPGLPRGWRVGPPFGTDMIVVVASTAPLFARPLPDSQALPAYLSSLQAAVDALRRRGGTVAAAAAILETRPGR